MGHLKPAQRWKVCALIVFICVETDHTATCQEFVISSYAGEALTDISFDRTGFPRANETDLIGLPPDAVAFAQSQLELGTAFDGRAAAFQSVYGLNATFVEVTGLPVELGAGFTLTAETDYQVEFKSTSDISGQMIPFEFVINSGELRIQNFASFEPFEVFGGAFASAEIFIDGLQWSLNLRLTKDDTTGLPVLETDHRDDFGINVHPTLSTVMDGADAVVVIPRIEGTVMVEGSQFTGPLGQFFDYEMSSKLEMLSQLDPTSAQTGLAGVSDPFALGTPDDPNDDLGGSFSPLGVEFLLNGLPLSDYPILAFSPDGDFNDDGSFGCLDVDALSAEIAAATNDASFDLNADGQVNKIDLETWLAIAGNENLPDGRPYSVGDANLDGFVDGHDFNIWNQNKFTQNTAWCVGNFTADDLVNGQDFVAWNTHKFANNDAVATPENTPMPLLVLASWLIYQMRNGRFAKRS